jgi:hypothetical protein
MKSSGPEASFIRTLNEDRITRAIPNRVNRSSGCNTASRGDAPRLLEKPNITARIFWPGMAAQIPPLAPAYIELRAIADCGHPATVSLSAIRRTESQSRLQADPERRTRRR